MSHQSPFMKCFQSTLRAHILVKFHIRTIMSSELSDISDDEILENNSRPASIGYKRYRLTADEINRQLDTDFSYTQQSVDSEDDGTLHQILARSISPVPAEPMTPFSNRRITSHTEQSTSTPISYKGSTQMQSSSKQQDEERTPHNRTPKTPTVHSMSTREILIQIYERQSEILTRLKENENVVTAKKMVQQVVVPPAVKNAVRQGFKDGKDRGFTWVFDDSKRVCDAVNEAMTSHIKTFIKGWNPTFNDPTVLNHALNRYFLTKKQENTAIHKDKITSEKKKRASYERKKEKTKRRITALDKMDISDVKKAKIRPALEAKYMSSDEECQDGFITHQPSWQSEKFKEYKSKLDAKFMEICSTKSRRLLLKRTIGCSSEKERPEVGNDTISWIVK